MILIFFYQKENAKFLLITLYSKLKPMVLAIRIVSDILRGGYGCWIVVLAQQMSYLSICNIISTAIQTRIAEESTCPGVGGVPVSEQCQALLHSSNMVGRLVRCTDR